MIAESRDEFFKRHNVEPCRYCTRSETPGTGIGPIIASMLFEAYRNAEIDRLKRKEQMGGESDGYDQRKQSENQALFIRACWLSNQDPACGDLRHDGIEVVLPFNDRKEAA